MSNAGWITPASPPGASKRSAAGRARSSRNARPGGGWLGLAFGLICTALPVTAAGDPRETPWEICQVDPQQQALLDADGNRALTIAVDGDTAIVEGTMTSAVVCKLRAMLAVYPNIRRLELATVHGSFDEEKTMKAARFVRGRGIATHARDGAKISSAGVDLFLGGVRRTIGRDVTFGIHSWSYNETDLQASDFPANHQEHAPYLAFYAKMGVPQAFYWLTLQTPNNRLHHMSGEELSRFGFSTE